MGLICKLFHTKEELLIWEERITQKDTPYQYERKATKWWRFKHCATCHEPLLDPKKKYSTPEEIESQARAKMLEESLTNAIK